LKRFLVASCVEVANPNNLVEVEGEGNLSEGKIKPAT
jgi:hypothetical protein